MSLPFSVATVCEILGVPSRPPTDSMLIQGITTDTRGLSAGEVFVALRGETFDGHAFIEKAIQLGAIAVVVDYKANINDSQFPVITVSETLVAYQAIARWWRQQFHKPVIAITGSVGKTTTKELISGVLGQFGAVHKTQANFNNEIGVPQTLLQIDRDRHDFAVVEMGMRGLREIALLSQITQPTIGLITNVGTAHIGRLGSEAAIAQAKCELLAEMPTGSTAILNHDNALLMQTAAGVWTGETLTYGLEGGDLHGKLLDTQTLQVGEWIFPLPLPGRHNALNFLAALAVAQILDLSWDRLVSGVTVEMPGGRSRRLELNPNIVLLDETYNAGLESMLAALQLLADTPGDRRIAVLGTMKELGDRAPEFHAQVGKRAHEIGLDAVFVLADEPVAEAIAEGAKPLPTACFTTHSDLIHHLQDYMQPGDRYLFKASRSVGLDRVVEQLYPAMTH